MGCCRNGCGEEKLGGGGLNRGGGKQEGAGIGVTHLLLGG